MAILHPFSENKIFRCFSCAATHGHSGNVQSAENLQKYFSFLSFPTVYSEFWIVIGQKALINFLAGGAAKHRFILIGYRFYSNSSVAGT